MNTHNTNALVRTVSRAFTVAVLLTCTALFMPQPIAFGGEGNAGNPGVIPPHAKYGGLSYGDWGGLWWRWAFSIPPEQNPVLDATGELGHVGQSGPVWFLAGTFGGPAERTVSVPAGKALFFPLINYFWVTTCVDEPRTIDGIRPLVAPFADAVDPASELSAEIDGVSVKNLGQYRGESRLFCTGLDLFGVVTVEDLLASGFCAEGVDYDPNCSDLPNPEEHYGPADGFGPAMSDGYWLMLAPLSVGEHTIHFAAMSGDLSLDVTYHLTVVPGK